MSEFARFRGRQVEILGPVESDSDFEKHVGRKLNKATGERIDNFVWTLDGGRRRLRAREELGLDHNRTVRTDNRTVRTDEDNRAVRTDES